MNASCIRLDFAYWTACRCPSCSRDQRRKLKLARVYGYQRPSADLAWERIDLWLHLGYSPTWIASAAGLAPRGVNSAIAERRTTGHQRSFGKHHTEAILRADILAATAGRCDARGARRRLRALAAIGWTVEALHAETGVHFVTLASIRRGESRLVNATLSRQISDLYERLCMVEGPSTQARNVARRDGWAPPLAWDDIDHDDAPAEAPERRRDTIAEHEHLLAAGESHDQALRALGITQAAYLRAIDRRRKVA